MSSDESVVATLRTVDLFDDLLPKDLDEIVACVRPMEFDDGDSIVVEGDTDSRFFLLMSGRAAVTVSDKPVVVLEAGQYFGEISLIDRGPRTATVTAMGPVETLTIASFAFRPILHANPDIMHRLLLKMCERVRQLDRDLVG
jgi:CRP-like cAMP-binding protein